MRGQVLFSNALRTNQAKTVTKGKTPRAWNTQTLDKAQAHQLASDCQELLVQRSHGPWGPTAFLQSLEVQPKPLKTVVTAEADDIVAKEQAAKDAARKARVVEGEEEAIDRLEFMRRGAAMLEEARADAKRNTSTNKSPFKRPAAKKACKASATEGKACSACTFVNSDGAAACTMCATPLATSAALVGCQKRRGRPQPSTHFILSDFVAPTNCYGEKMMNTRRMP